MQRNLPLVGGNTLKLGLFGANCSNGRTYAVVPERWDPSWRNNVALARLADEVGLECLVPIARWKGYGGRTNLNGTAFEPTTWAGGLLAATKRINAFTTIHVPLIHPLIAAKQLVTVDHISEGRLGVNLVCGWNDDEFLMFGVQKKEHDDRYVEGDEWWSIIRRLWSGETFDFPGTYFQLQGVEGAPAPYGGKPPLVMNAGASPKGRDFAIRNSDLHFTGGYKDPQDWSDSIADTKRRASALGRTIQVWSAIGVVCRPTAQEADDYAQYVVEHADEGAVGKARSLKLGDAPERVNDPRANEVRWKIIARGSYCIIGDPEHVADQLARFSRSGFDGLVMNFVNYLDELPYFAQEVLPRLERQGLRLRA